jgi:hypothetical protein
VLRSIVALIGGFALMAFALLIATIAVALAMGVTADSVTTSYFQVLVACAALAAAFGGYATASLAPARHAAHAAILATMVLIAQASTALNPPANQPRWYLMTLVVVAPLGALAGGLLRQRQRRRRAEVSRTA